MVSAQIDLRNWPDASPKAAKSADLPSTEDLPLVSLVIPSYNQGKYLEYAIKSVLNQGYPNLECFVIDGGSADGSVAILREYSNLLTYWESEPDQGQSHAINKGWHKANGKYLWWLNADDMLTPSSLITAVSFLEANPDIDLIYGNVYRIDSSGRLLDEFAYRDFDLDEFLIGDHDISQAGALTRRSVLDRIGMLNERYHYVMDREFWLRVGLSGGKLAHAHAPLALFRIHDETKTQAGSPDAVKERYELYSWLMEHPNLSSHVRSNTARIWSSVHLDSARVYMKCGAFTNSLGELRRAVRNRPSSVVSSSFWASGVLSALGL
ncbi:MAG: glycosyltransferase family 2 protein, partial [Anaerolineales bacterium]